MKRTQREIQENQSRKYEFYISIRKFLDGFGICNVEERRKHSFIRVYGGEVLEFVITSSTLPPICPYWLVPGFHSDPGLQLLGSENFLPVGL